MLRVLERVRRKVDSLKFLNPTKFGWVLEAIEHVLAHVPKTGWIEGTAYLQLMALMDYLQDPARILAGPPSLEVEVEEEPPRRRWCRGFFSARSGYGRLLGRAAGV